MFTFVIASVVWTAILVGAGYSHYRYRVEHNEQYRDQFGANYTGGVW
ncbi:hypothetical protein SAMN06265795_102286 [Noviherbaspirillum humi]|uniref:Uncharacterized protein n=1 Tax=Noviherbaspirillum humi TaxID=1688639 RepID=A0A239DPB1_9BURK|nr:hypothetical protein [Noviherbaspirillum humi]SNS34009.1 hypothetical protein SAMN06265795_102286 [Noviherbaspirillum humi]